MKGKTLKKFMAATFVWTATAILLMTSASNLISTRRLFVWTVLGLIILWFSVNTFIILYFIKDTQKNEQTQEEN